MRPALGAGTYRGCTAYNDYRELLARPDIDAVVIVTPDHWHAMQSIHAVEAGKDVYCEKPISLTIREGRRLVEAVRRYGRIFQTGTQYRSIPTIRQVCEFVRAGGLGKVKSVFTLWGKIGGHLGVDSYVPLPFALPAEPVPDGLDWDLWVGPAPWQPYNSAYHRNPIPGVVPWAFHEDFGAAAVTWYHSHAADVIQYALGMENSGPVEIIHPSTGPVPDAHVPIRQWDAPASGRSLGHGEGRVQSRPCDRPTGGQLRRRVRRRTGLGHVADHRRADRRRPR